MKFKVSPNANTNGTSRIGEITCCYADIVKKFGGPIESDGYKVSGEWVFESDEGQVFTLYDWKATELYHGQGCSIEMFRSLPSFTFNIGGHSKSFEFIGWLKTEL